ncbi:hypothetical protein J3838_004416 [Salmonella enterica subsp. enterica serovar Sandiego]|nr:hypothetical protein [Salmonella enterica subsp. enterica serovar Sandiego]EHG2959870.1 hypothetical protein [Salmonella enterica subsp. enterica serovar Sandiego]
MKGTLLGHSAFHYLVSIDDYYVAVWAAVSRDLVPELVQEMFRGVTVCFAFKNSDKQTVIDFMVSEDNRLIANGSMNSTNLIGSKYRGYPRRKHFF